jgi:hypothetical protein
MLWFIDLAEGECNITDQNDVTIDDTMFDGHRRDTLCILVSGYEVNNTAIVTLDVIF